MTTDEAIEEFRIAAKNKKDISMKDSKYSEMFYRAIFNKEEKRYHFFSQNFIYFYTDDYDGGDEYTTYDNLEEFIREIKNNTFYKEWERN
jgi:hypothetical protein